jgi:membrane protease YdiL (CAAX protease family)
MHPSSEWPVAILARKVREAFRPPQRQPTVVLLAATVLMLVWASFGSPEFLARRFAAGTGDDGRAAGAIGGFVACFVLLGVIPAAIVGIVFRGRLAEYGVGLGDPPRTLRAILLLAPVFLAAAYAGSRDPAILAKFPINPRAGDSGGMFALHAASYLLFYLGWEFLFRGFLLFGLRPALGDVNAVLVQTMASALLHLGSPAAETFGAIPAGVLWGAIALFTRSLLPGLVHHFLLGIALDALICLR